jgi:predicted RNA-binding protein Jag
MAYGISTIVDIISAKRSAISAMPTAASPVEIAVASAVEGKKGLFSIFSRGILAVVLAVLIAGAGFFDVFAAGLNNLQEEMWKVSLQGSSFLFKSISIFSLEDVIVIFVFVVIGTVSWLSLERLFRFRRIAILHFILITYILLSFNLWLVNLSLLSGRYNQQANLRLVGSGGRIFKYQGPIYLRHGNNKDGIHVFEGGKKERAQEVVNQLAKEKGINCLLLLSCNSRNGKLGPIEIKCIHAGGKMRKTLASLVLTGGNLNKGTYFCSQGWYLVLPSGEEIELGEAIKKGLVGKRSQTRREKILGSSPILLSMITGKKRSQMDTHEISSTSAVERSSAASPLIEKEIKDLLTKLLQVKDVKEKIRISKEIIAWRCKYYPEDIPVVIKVVEQGQILFFSIPCRDFPKDNYEYGYLLSRESQIKDADKKKIETIKNLLEQFLKEFYKELEIEAPHIMKIISEEGHDDESIRVFISFAKVLFGEKQEQKGSLFKLEWVLVS